MPTNIFANTQHIQGGLSEVAYISTGDVTECKDECTINNGNPKAVIFISKYMIKKYGINEAINRIIKRGIKIKKV